MWTIAGDAAAPPDGGDYRSAPCLRGWAWRALPKAALAAQGFFAFEQEDDPLADGRGPHLRSERREVTVGNRLVIKLRSYAARSFLGRKVGVSSRWALTKCSNGSRKFGLLSAIALKICPGKWPGSRLPTTYSLVGTDTKRWIQWRSLQKPAILLEPVARLFPVAGTLAGHLVFKAEVIGAEAGHDHVGSIPVGKRHQREVILLWGVGHEAGVENRYLDVQAVVQIAPQGTPRVSRRRR